MTEPFQAEPPDGPMRLPRLADRLRAAWRMLWPVKPTVRTLLVCSHRYANGTSAWSACVWGYGSAGWAWYSRCARCGLVAQCR